MQDGRTDGVAENVTIPPTAKQEAAPAPAQKRAIADILADYRKYRYELFKEKYEKWHW